jgi:hypothetical protein
MRNDNLIDILTPIRQGAAEEVIKELFIKANLLREPYNTPLKGNECLL